MNATERGDLVETMLPVAANLACLVHGDGGPEDIQQVLAGLGGAQRDALLVVLAGMVDPDRPLGQALGWLETDEHGRPIVPDWDRQETLRDLCPEPDVSDWDGVDEVAVDRWLSGVRTDLTRAERVAAALEGLRRGLSYADLDQLAGVGGGGTQKMLTRERARREAAGEPIDVFDCVSRQELLSEEQVVRIRERSAAGETDLEISMSVGLSRKTVGLIVNGQSYAGFGGPLREVRPRKPVAAARLAA